MSAPPTKSRVVRNTFILYARMIVTLLVSLYTSRVVLQQLGVVDFGILNVVGGVIALLSFLERSIITTFQRFLCIEIAKGTIDTQRKVLGSAYWIQFIVALSVILLGETAGLWFVEEKLVIPVDRLEAAKVLYQITIAIFVVNMVRVIYNALIISYEEMSAYAYLCIFEAIGKLLIAYLLMATTHDSLITYSFLLLGVNIVITISYYLIAIRKCGNIHPIWLGVTSYFKKMISFASLNIVGSMSHVIKNQGLNFLLNIFGETTVLNAARSISLQVYTAVYSFVTNFQTAFAPFQMKTFHADSATGNEQKLFELTRFSFYILSVMAIPIIYATDYILHLWLGDNVPYYTVPFTRIVLFMGIFEALSNPLINNIYAEGKIKILQILVFIINMGILTISYLLLSYGFDCISVYIADFVAAILCYVTRIYIAYRYTGLKVWHYILEVIRPLALLSFIALAIYCLFALIGINMWCAILATELAFLFLVYYYLEPQLRSFVIAKFKRR